MPVVNVQTPTGEAERVLDKPPKHSWERRVELSEMMFG